MKLHYLWSYLIKKYLSLRIKFNYRVLFFGANWYEKWIQQNEQYDYDSIKRDIESFEKKPKLSIILPVYNVEESYLVECIESVREQYYENWELCISDDNSTLPHIKSVLDYYLTIESKIKVIYRKENGHISVASNTSLQIATGEYVVLLDHDDKLPIFSLYEVIKAINNYPVVDMLFSNEDKLLNGKRAFPFFKKKWGLSLLLNANYICHLTVIRTELIKKIGGFRIGYEGAQDWDLVLRIWKMTDRIFHIPKILYHWRISAHSTAGGEGRKKYIRNVHQKVIDDARKRIFIS